MCLYGAMPVIWRNASDMAHHYYAPTVGHPAANDFKAFSQSETILMENDVTDIYN